MKRILLCGCCGKMGRVITRLVGERDDCLIVAGVDLQEDRETGAFPVYSSVDHVEETVDVIIDFSHPSLLSSLLAYAKEHRVPIVLCTTGYTAEQVEELKEASQKTAVFYSRNMSIGINLLIELSKKAAQVLGSDFDIEIVEEHHNQKIDAPSGTALMIADAIRDSLDSPVSYMYDRHSQRKKREKNEIGIHSIRGGTIVGEHEVIFAGNNEVIRLSHSAQSKEVFASGAVNAALFLAEKPAGLYDMSAMV